MVSKKSIFHRTNRAGTHTYRLMCFLLWSGNLLRFPNHHRLIGKPHSLFLYHWRMWCRRRYRTGRIDYAMATMYSLRLLWQWRVSRLDYLLYRLAKPVGWNAGLWHRIRHRQIMRPMRQCAPTTGTQLSRVLCGHNLTRLTQCVRISVSGILSENSIFLFHDSSQRAWANLSSSR
jgi:hypothetical protein